MARAKFDFEAKTNIELNFKRVSNQFQVCVCVCVDYSSKRFGQGRGFSQISLEFISFHGFYDFGQKFFLKFQTSIFTFLQEEQGESVMKEERKVLSDLR